MLESVCAVCGTTECLQRHHISYEPEETIILCVKHHRERHKNHGVGVGIGYSQKPVVVKKEFIKLWNEGKTYDELMKSFDISSATVLNWRNRLNLNGRFSGLILGSGKKNINIEVSEDFLWRFRQLKIKFRVKNNTELLEKLVELGGEEELRTCPKDVIREWGF